MAATKPTSSGRRRSRRAESNVDEPQSAVASFDPTQSREAFESIRQELSTIPADQLLIPRVEVQRSAVAALNVAQRDAAPAREARFARLASFGEFDLEHLRRLPRLALATWYARGRQVESGAIETNAVVRADTVQRAQETRARMLRLLEYHFDDDPVMSPRLAFIRSGSGYLDLANDLQGLASIYAQPEVLDAIEDDRRRYRASDPQEALALASALMTALGVRGTSQGDGWPSIVQRSWTALFRAYKEVQAAGMFLFRNEEDVVATYPNLVSVARSRRPSSPGDDGDETESGGDGGR